MDFCPRHVRIPGGAGTLRKVSAQWILAQGPGSVEILATKVQCGQQCWYKNSLMHIREVYPRACLFPGAHAPSLPLCTSFLSLNNLDLLSCLVLSSCLFFFSLLLPWTPGIYL